MNGARRRPRARLVALVAGITAVALVLTSTVTWFVVTTQDVGDGTAAELVRAGSAGAWHPVAPMDLVTDTEISAGASRQIALPDAPASSSWFVAISATAGAKPARLALGPGQAEIVVLDPGATVSLSALVGADAEGGFELSASADLVVSVSAYAYLEDGADGIPAPGGSVAVTARTVLDTEHGTGAGVDDLDIAISPRGLGGVPSTGVAAVWLQLSSEAPVELADASGHGFAHAVGTHAEHASGLVLASLDEDGLVRMRLTSPSTSTRAAVVGWVASADRTRDASVIRGGLLAGAMEAGVRAESDGATVTAEGVLPDGSVGLWSVAVAEHGDPVVVHGEGDDYATQVPVRGAASVLVASDGVIRGPDVLRATFLGYFPGGGDGEPAITIDPLGAEPLDLVAGGGRVTFGGEVEAPRGIQRVDVRVGDRYVGTAEVGMTEAGLRWRLEAIPPAGESTIQAVVVDITGASASVELRFVAAEPPPDAVIVTPDTVVLSASQREAVRRYDGASIEYLGAAPAHVGDVIVSEVTAAAPAGFMVRVLSIESRDGVTFLSVQDAELEDVFLQAAFDVRDRAVSASALGRPADILGTAAGGGGVVAARSAADASSATTEVGSVVFEGEVEISGPVGSADAGILDLDRAEVEFTMSVEVEAGPYSDKKSLTVGAKANDGSLMSEQEYHREMFQKRTEGRTVALEAAVSYAFEQRLTLSYTFILDINWSASRWWEGPKLERLKSTVTSELSRNWSAEASVAFDFSEAPAMNAIEKWVKRTFALPIATATVFVGVVPIVLLLKAGPEVRASFTISASSIHSRSSERLEFGFDYRDGQFHAVNERSNTRDPVPPRIAIEFSAKLGLGVSAELSLYGAIHAKLGAIPTLTWKSTYNFEGGQLVDSTSSLTFAVVLTAGVSVGIDTIMPLDFSYDWEAFGFTVFEDERSSEQPETSDPVDLVDEVVGSSGSGERPLVMVVDVSGSMAGERIEEARAALTQVVQSQPAGASMGIWTYPSDGGCGGGGFRIPIQQFTATGELLDVIDQLQVGGNTPTGEAISAVAAQLLSEGITGATILLVTDGEANCGVDSCEVVQDLRQQGFDITVHSVSYRISDAGRAQLECLSQHTGGSTIDIEDAAELEHQIAELSKAEVSVRIRVPAVARVGEAAQVEIVVVNSGARDVTGAEFRVGTAAGSMSADIGPSVVASLGNIPSGATVTRTVSVTPHDDAGGVEGDVRLEVSAWGRNTTQTTVSTELAVSEDAAITPGELFASRGDAVVVLGDGFAVSPLGEGDEPAGCAGDGSASDRVVVLACPGAASVDVLDRSQLVTGAAAAAPQVSRLDAAAASIVLSAGAEDVGLGELLERCEQEECRMSDPDMQTAILSAQLIDMSDVYRRTSAALGGAPVVVTAYPWLFPEVAPAVCGHYSQEEAMVFNTIVGYLNAANEASAARASAAGAPVTFSTSTRGALRPDRTFCSEEPGVVRGDDGIAMTREGAMRLSDALAQWSRDAEPISGTASHAERSAVDHHLLSDTFSPAVTVTVDADSADDSVLAAVLGATSVHELQELQIVGSGYRPGALAIAMLSRTDTRALASGVVDEDGRIALTAVVPAGYRAGGASIDVFSVAADGRAVESSVRIAITESAPLWVALLAVFAMVALGGGFLCMTIAGARRLRRTRVSLRR